MDEPGPSSMPAPQPLSPRGVWIGERAELVHGAQGWPLVEEVQRRYLATGAEALSDARASPDPDDPVIRLHPEQATTWDGTPSGAARAVWAAGLALELESTAARP
jgi:hypothetical protein